MSLKRARKPFEVRTSSEKKSCPTKKTHRFLPKKPLASPHCPSPSSSSTWSPQAAPMTVNESFGAKWIHITRGCPGKKVAHLWQNTVSKLWKQRVMRYLYLLVHKDVKNPVTLVIHSQIIVVTSYQTIMASFTVIASVQAT